MDDPDVGLGDALFVLHRTVRHVCYRRYRSDKKAMSLQVAVEL